MSTRVYERQTIRWERADIEALEAAGRAQYFPGLPGYVIDKKIPVRNHQINEADPQPPILVASPPGLKVVDTNAYVRAQERRAEAVGPALVPDSADEDALLARFGV